MPIVELQARIGVKHKCGNPNISALISWQLI